jgi:hypothetical protein
MTVWLSVVGIEDEFEDTTSRISTTGAELRIWGRFGRGGENKKIFGAGVDRYLRLCKF